MERNTRKTRLNQKHSTEQMFIAMASKTNYKKLWSLNIKQSLLLFVQIALSAFIIIKHFNEIFWETKPLQF